MPDKTAVEILTEDLESYVEERRWDETKNGGEARDKNFDVVMARCMIHILPKMEHVTVCKDNPSALWFFRNKTVKAVGMWAFLFAVSYASLRILEIIFGLEEIIKTAFGL